MDDSQSSSYTQTKTSNLAVISLVAGILTWLIIPIIGAIVAIVTGHLAKKEIRESNGAISGNGMATAGLVLGYIQIIVPVCAVVVIVILTLLGPSIGDVFSNIVNELSAP